MSDFKPRFLKPSESSSYLDRKESPLVDATDFIYNRFNSQSLEVQRQKLPIFNHKRDILYLLEKYQMVVLVGETGSGKSTQIPQYLIEAKWPPQVGVCEPRKVAAISLANRIADETGSFVQGDIVGYTVRFDSCKTQPKIKYMTEGILLREIMGDPLLKKYSVIMIDEVHERTLYTDILLGLMKKILKKRKELRLLVASATVDAKEFQDFFEKGSDANSKKPNSAILSVRGRQHPVDIFYLKEPTPCYVQCTIDTVLKINGSEPVGDILAFLTGQEEVDRAVRILREHANSIEQEKKKNKMEVFPMYGALPHYEQLKVFRSVADGYRKVIIATNVAETSVTIPGIVYVIDCGFVKLKWFNDETHSDSLVIMPISKASANQRAGRAGRIKHGKCYRLYTEDGFSKLADSTPPEMVRSNLTYVVLQLKAMGISNILQFNFPSPPPVKNLKSAVEILYALNAIDINGELTRPLGFNMAEFAIDPLYSKILFSSGEFGCSEEILTIISMLQVESVFTKPSTGNMIAKSRIQRRNFEVEEGDLITYLNIYTAFVQSQMDKGFCHKNFINYKAMKRVSDIRQGLEKMALNYNIPLISCHGNTEAICKCLVTGLFPNAVYLHYSGVYKTIRGNVELWIHPDSVLYTIQQPQWLLFCEVIQTTKLFMRDLTVIKSDWLLDLVPHFYHRTTCTDY